jgi:hypothetical protein
MGGLEGTRRTTGGSPGTAGAVPHVRGRAIAPGPLRTSNGEFRGPGFSPGVPAATLILRRFPRGDPVASTASGVGFVVRPQVRA